MPPFAVGLLDEVDGVLARLLDGAPLLLTLAIAFLLGLRHASDPDHLVAVTSLVAADQADSWRAARLGAWWGAGHASALIVVGLPLIAFKASMPAWFAAGAEKAIGVVIVALAGRLLWKWAHGDYRARAHSHDDDSHGPRRHLHREHEADHDHRAVRTTRRAAWIGLLHGLAGTGAVVVLLIAAVPSSLAASLALLVFAPMSLVSMMGWTACFAWLLTRPALEPAYRTFVIPALGLLGIMFGVSYAGLG